jgi:hypothetical protein
MKSARWGSKILTRLASLASIVAFSALAGPWHAVAQGFVSPYGDPFHEPADMPGPDGPRARIARILARHGYNLAGSLRRRGDEIVAFGIDEDGLRMRFIIDPDEGEILSSKPLAPAFSYDDPEESFVPEDPYGSADSPERDSPRLRENLAPLGPPAPNLGRYNPHSRFVPEVGEEGWLSSHRKAVFPLRPKAGSPPVGARARHPARRSARLVADRPTPAHSVRASAHRAKLNSATKLAPARKAVEPSRSATRRGAMAPAAKPPLAQPVAAQAPPAASARAPKSSLPASATLRPLKNYGPANETEPKLNMDR